MSTTTAPRDEERVSELKQKFIDAAKDYRHEMNLVGVKRDSFTAIVKEAINAQVTPDEIKEWGSGCGLTPQAINLALRKAGIRQRAERSDKGKSKGGGCTPIVPDGSPVIPATASTFMTTDPIVWADELMTRMGNDPDKALDFIDQMMTRVSIKAAA
jgi:hypothetical protein